jgi:hypothetical protein
MHINIRERGNMARKIEPTPVLDPRSTETFLRKVESSHSTKTGPIATPKLSETLKKFTNDTSKKE